MYSHVVYDIVPDEKVVVSGADIVIIEGLNVLQTRSGAPEFVSDYFDFSIYVDADEARHRAVVRRALPRVAGVGVPGSRLVLPVLRRAERRRSGRNRPRIWREINGLNLRENIEPTRERASLIVHKTADHRVDRVQLLRL